MLSINISELVLTVISFFLLLFLLKHFLYDPLIRFMDERKCLLHHCRCRRSNACRWRWATYH